MKPAYGTATTQLRRKLERIGDSLRQTGQAAPAAERLAASGTVAARIARRLSETALADGGGDER